MRKTLSIFLAFSLMLAFAQAATASAVEVSLTVGEQFVIPEGRRGEIGRAHV